MNEIYIIYDFDGTLTKSKYPEYPIINKTGHNMYELWDNVVELMKDGFDSSNAFFYTLWKYMIESNIELTLENILTGSMDIKLSDGLDTYFNNINLENKSIKHYIVTNGLKEFIENTKISPYIEEIYGTSYYFIDNKLQCVKRTIESLDKINCIKDILKTNNEDVFDCSRVIYIGDGLTDSHAMEFVKKFGGLSIGVYQDSKNEVIKLFENKFISHYYKADFNKDSDLYNKIKEFIN